MRVASGRRVRRRRSSHLHREYKSTGRRSAVQRDPRRHYGKMTWASSATMTATRPAPQPLFHTYARQRLGSALRPMTAALLVVPRPDDQSGGGGTVVSAWTKGR